MIFKLGDVSFSSPSARVVYHFDEKAYIIDIELVSEEEVHKVQSVNFDGILGVYSNYESFSANKPLRVYSNCTLVFITEDIREEKISFKLSLRCANDV